MQFESSEIESLLGAAKGQLWRGRLGATGMQAVITTGHPSLDKALPGDGWPQGVVTELLLKDPVNGVLRLLLPVMRALSDSGRWLSWINPPAIPYAPALAQAGIDLQRSLWLPDLDSKSAWWAMEQLAQQPSSGLVLGWLEPANMHVIRRLQLAVEAGGGMAVLCRQETAGKQPSAAALRLLLRPDPDALNVIILKSRSGLQQQVIKIN